MEEKVSVIGTVGLPACYGGFESLVENLVRYKSKKINYHVYCSKGSYKARPDKVDGAELTYIPLKANGIQSVPYDILSMLHCMLFKRPDVILILGVSGCIFLPFLRFFTKSKIVTNIDGLEWRRDKWGAFAKKFLKFSESVAVKFSDVIIADNKAIGDYVTDEYNKDNEIIAYGGDHAIREIDIESEQQDYALGLCRIEPENNVEMILKAFSQTNKKLKFVGNWSSSEFGKKLKSIYSNFENIVLLDPIYDLDQLYALRKNCSLYLHGHSAGGTNPSLVEMMHFGVPIYAFDCDFNRYSTEEKASYFSDGSQLISKLKSFDPEFSANGVAMEEIALRRYTWEKVASLYESTYE
jgi:glycosyltransferase involved in cell wall biosynthesis